MNNVTQIHQKTEYQSKEIPLTKCPSCSAWTGGDTYLKLGHWLKGPLYMPVP